MLFLWSIILIGHIGLQNYGGILVIRFLLGLFESMISPSCMAICNNFYTVKNQPLRMCIFLSFNGVATIVGSLLSWGLGHADESKLKIWKLIFGHWSYELCLVRDFLWLCPDSPKLVKF